MPTPGLTDMHINSYLTDVSVAYVQSANNFIADKVFPAIPVQKKSDTYAIFDRGDFLRDEMQKRGPGAESAGGGYRVSNDTYSCDVFAFHKDVADQERANADSPFAPDRDAATFLAQKYLIKRDVQWATDYFTTGVWTGSTTGTDLVGNTDFTKWSDASSTPIEDVLTQAAAIESATGLLPNRLVVNRNVWNALRQHPDIVDRIKHTSTGVVTEQLVAQLMGVEQVLVAAGVKNTAQEGLSASTSYIVGNSALLCYSAPSPGLYQPSAGYTFLWTGLVGSNAGQAISTFRLERNKADRHEIEVSFDHKVVASVLGAFFSTAI